MRSILLFLFTLMLATGNELSAADSIRVLIWDEQQPAQRRAYGGKMLGETIAAHLETKSGLSVRTARLDDTEQGLGDSMINTADVLVFWSHVRVKEQDDAHAEAIVKRVMDGKLSLVALHSAHWAKPFVRLMQERAKADAIKEIPEAERSTSKWEYLNENPYQKMVKNDTRLTPFIEKGEGSVWKLTLPQCVFPTWRADGAPSDVTTLLTQHPIAKGLPATWDIPQTEMYGEPFHVPPPDEVIFEEKWDKGEHFRSGCVWQVGKGYVFYFRPGHETFPIYKQAEPLRVIENAVRWLPTKAASLVSKDGEPTNAEEAAAQKEGADALVAAETTRAKTNIIYLLSDDMGYGDIGFNGCKDIRTPNLDQLAKQGAILECLYGQPVCSPTRAALLTGRYPTHTGVYNVVSARDPKT